MRQAVAGNIRLINEFFYIKELMPEQKASKQTNWDTLYIPPFILLHMLDFLSSRQVETMRAQRALEVLQVLVHHDQGRVIAEELQDISWEILGICQQISWNLRAALYSFQQSLSQYPQNRIQTATRDRIRDLHLPT